MIENKEELLELKRNIISWYPFEKNSKILEIWEGIETINTDNQANCFDYVVIVGIGQKEIDDLIDFAKIKLKEDGILLLAIDNEIGINNLCTETTDSIKKISRNKIEKILSQKGFYNKKFYYPLPNYKYTNVIFTDNFLPDVENLERCLTIYDDSVQVALDERKRFKQLINEDVELFKKMANSFFIETTRSTLKDNNIRFVSFNNARKKQYRMKTIIQEDKVYKYPSTDEAKQHLEEIKHNIDILKSNSFCVIDSYDEDRIISEFKDTKLLLNNIILEKIKEKKGEEILNIIIKFENELFEKFNIINPENNCFDKYNIEYKIEEIENLHFIKDGLWDMFFQNCFYIDNSFYFYDQEWIEENIPIEFILFRAIKYFGKELFNIVNKDVLYEKLNIDEKQIDLFEKLDDIIQNNIRNTKIWDIHKDKKEINYKLIEIDNLEKENIAKGKKIEQLEDEINKKEEKIKDLKDELCNIKNSRSWKLTEPIRKAKEMLKK